MRTTYYTLLFLLAATSLFAQTPKADKNAPVVHFVLTDSTVVSGRVVSESPVSVVVEKRNGELTYLPPRDIVRTTQTQPRRAPISTGVTSYTLKDGAIVYGRLVRETPEAVVVRQANGTQTFIDPADIVATAIVTAPEAIMANPAPQAIIIGSPYLLGSRTAYMPRAGTSYYRNAYFLRNEIEGGISNGWSVGAIFNPLWRDLPDASEYMAEALYTNTDFGTQLYTRVGVPLGGSVRVGAILTSQLQTVRNYYYNGGRVDYTSDVLAGFNGQVLATFGKPHSNVTLGYTFEIGENKLFSQLPGTLTIGTSQQLSPMLTIVSDNRINVRSDALGPLARLGVALRIRSRFHAFDMGANSTLDNRVQYSRYGTTLGILYRVFPYVGYLVQLGGRTN